MNGRLDKVAMTNKLMQLKRELHYKCEIGEKVNGNVMVRMNISIKYLIYWMNIGNKYLKFNIILCTGKK